jgi:hypothetical protein
MQILALIIQPSIFTLCSRLTFAPSLPNERKLQYLYLIGLFGLEPETYERREWDSNPRVLANISLRIGFHNFDLEADPF